MKKSKTTAILLIAILTIAAACLPGCGSGQSGAADEENSTYVPGMHEAYGVTYSVPEPDTDWTYMYDAEQLGNGEEFIDLEIAGRASDKDLEAVWKEAGEPDESGSKTIGDKTCYWYDSCDSDGMQYWSKVLLIPQAEENKYIEIRSDFIETEEKDKADAFFEELLNGIEITGDKGNVASKEYLLAGGVKIPAEGLEPVQIFYGMTNDENEKEGFISAQIDFDKDNYEKGAVKTFKEYGWDDYSKLLADGPIEIDGAEGKWYTWLDNMPDSLPYISHVVLFPNDETQTLMQIDYDFNGDVKDTSQYDDQFEELDGLIHFTKSN